MTKRKEILSQPRGEEPELTEQEISVLQSVADGHSIREVSAELEIGENRIQYHMNRIMRKLGVPNRTAAVAVALRRGLIPQNEILSQPLAEDRKKLTEKEICILQSVADGKKYRQVSADLMIHELSIHWMMHAIIRKLAVPNGCAAVAVALRRGIID